MPTASRQVRKAFLGTVVVSTVAYGTATARTQRPLYRRRKHLPHHTHTCPARADLMPLVALRYSRTAESRRWHGCPAAPMPTAIMIQPVLCTRIAVAIRKYWQRRTRFISPWRTTAQHHIALEGHPASRIVLIAPATDAAALQRRTP
jgi:hypothetical protein